MKYYYNGRKLRTSDNTYTHALISIDAQGDICLWGCCGRYDLAIKRYNAELADASKGKANAIEQLANIENGTYLKWGFDNKGNYCRCKQPTNEDLLKDKVMFEDQLARCNRIIKTLEVVELEARP